MNKFKWIWRVLTCKKHFWQKTLTSQWNEEKNSTNEPKERLAFCTKCSLAVRVEEWKEVGL